jgi:acyl-CoA thioester hydrolase
MPRFELSLRPQAADIDGMGHVNNIVYVRWIQEVAAAHWNAVTSPELRAQLAWVVVRHEIDYKGAVRPGDEVLARTQVTAATAATCERRTEILAAGGRLVTAARTVWCAVDPASGRARRLPAEVKALFGL